MLFRCEFECACETARKVGEYLSKQSEKIVDSELGKDIKLELDRKSEELIVSDLLKRFEYPVLSEEAGFIGTENKDGLFWIIDPIDGTLNYSRDNPVSCVSIALWQGGEPILGVIYDFNRGELFAGHVNEGVWLDGTKIEHRVNRERTQSVLATGFPTYLETDEEALREYINSVQSYKKIRMIGSAALSLAYVAVGRFDAYKEKAIKLWDVAAGVAMVKALGGTVIMQPIADEYTLEVYCGFVE